ncbi:hypothetical protein AFAEC_0864 [Aliarcobacter faecis]|uniref:hypothetical protein n=1 Tax=Aliarcobacter faecis TaxID=1564138 RepID=UPI00047CAA6D|nr:hypothetical protein [Aliarcobacter faecis]QKF73039.1 hypothetical protein AFAEC_0864 [Aliarcobacter faecis]
MKKILLGLVAIVLIILAVCFTLRSNVNGKIDAKIEELKTNGFSVTYNKKDVPLKIEAEGKIEISDSQKALDYLIKIQDEGEFKKSFEKVVKVIDKQMIEQALLGVSFDYDFNINLLSSKLDLNLYLTKFSNSLMQVLSSEDQTKGLSAMLKNRDFQINVDENSNYKIKDINYVVPAEGTISFQGMRGDKKNLNIDLIKFDAKKDNFIFSFEGIKSFYEEKPNKAIDSKFNIENIKVIDSKFNFDMKGLKTLSTQKVLNDLLEADTKIAFDSLSFKNFDNLNTTIENSFIELSLSKIPFTKYEEFLDTYYSLSDNQENLDNFSKKAQEFFQDISKAGIEIKINANSKGFSALHKEWFKEIDLKSNFNLNKNLSNMKFEGLDDIFETIGIELKVDNNSAETIYKELGLNQANINLVDSEDKKFKVFKAELKEDGIYVNNSLTLPKAVLKFPKKEIENSYVDDLEAEDYPQVIEDDSNISYDYKMIDKDTLRVNFKYKTSLPSISNGGISVSFPQFNDDSNIKTKTVQNFKKLDVFKKGDTLYSGLLNKNIVAEYLMIEAFDENWKDINIEKEFTLDIDVSKMDDFLEMNLRGYSTATDGINYELLPNFSDTKDQQAYYIKIADIDLQKEKAKFK